MTLEEEVAQLREALQYCKAQLVIARAESSNPLLQKFTHRCNCELCQRFEDEVP